MQKSEQNIVRYPLNKNTKLTVVQIPDGNALKIRLTLTHNTKAFKPLVFATPDQMADFFGTLDYTSEQQPLPLIEAESEKLIKTVIRNEIRVELELVKQGKKTIDEAMEQIDLYVDDMIGKDDDDTYNFPVKWDTNQRKNWISSRNHKRRQERSAYKG